MALKEPRSMAEIHKLREKIALKTKRMSLHSKLIWIHRQAKALGQPEDSLRQGRSHSV